MLKKISSYIKKHQIFLPQEKILLAVSGGPDSVALLDIMLKLGVYCLAVAHFNHLTRGEASDGDESFVKELAIKYGIPFISDRADVKKLAKEQGLSFQVAARNVRYEFLRRAAHEFGASKIALAHQADDQTETILLNIIRGSGLKGLSGIAPLDGDLARPLLEVTREEIEKYLQKNELSYRIDASNAENYYSRNRLRHEVIPLLTKFNPALNATFGKTADILRAEEGYLSNITSEYFYFLAASEGQGISFSTKEILPLDTAIKRRIILMALTKIAGTEKDFSYRHVEDILELFSSGSGLTLHLPHSVRVTTAYGKILFNKADFSKVNISSFNTLLKVPGETLLEGIGSINAEYVDAPAAKSDAFTVYIEEKNLALPFYARSRTPGDIFRPLGGKGRIKIKEFFIDLHIRQENRDGIPLIADSAGDIVWVTGVRPSEKCRVVSGGKMLKLIFNPCHYE